MIRRGPAFNTSQMLARTQLLQVPQFPWQARLVGSLSLPLPWLHASELKSAQQLLKLGTAFAFTLCSISYTQKPEGTESEREETLQGDPFSSFVPPVPIQLSQFAGFAQTHSRASSARSWLVVCLSLLNPNHFIHHLPKQEIKSKISLSSSDVVYFPSPTFAH